MRGIKNFLKQNLSAMVDYILVVSTPIHDTYNPHSGHPAFSHQRLEVVNSLHHRGSTIPSLEREAIPLLPHVLDIPRHLACVSSSLMRSARLVGSKPSSVERDHLSDLCSRCFEVEEIALKRVSQLATVESHPVALRWDVPRHRLLDGTPHSPPSPTSPIDRVRSQSFQLSTSPSPSDLPLPPNSYPLPDGFPALNPASGNHAVFRRGSVPEISSRRSPTSFEERVPRTLSRLRLRPNSISTDPISTLICDSAEQSHTPSPSVQLLRNSDASSALNESSKKNKNIFNGFLIRR